MSIQNINTTQDNSFEPGSSPLVQGGTADGRVQGILKKAIDPQEDTPFFRERLKTAKGVGFTDRVKVASFENNLWDTLQRKKLKNFSREQREDLLGKENLKLLPKKQEEWMAEKMPEIFAEEKLDTRIQTFDDLTPQEAHAWIRKQPLDQRLNTPIAYSSRRIKRQFLSVTKEVEQLKKQHPDWSTRQILYQAMRYAGLESKTLDVKGIDRMLDELLEFALNPSEKWIEAGKEVERMQFGGGYTQEARERFAENALALKALKAAIALED